MRVWASCSLPGPDATGEELLRDADIALYEAKYSGKSCYRFFESSMLDGVVSQDAAEERARIPRQPPGSADSSLPTDPERADRAHDRPRGAHALATPDPRASLPDFVHRVRRRDRGDRDGRGRGDGHGLRPGGGVAGPRDQLSDDLGEPVGHASCTIRVVVDMVTRSLKKYGLPPEDLTIEITESITMKGAEQAIERLQQLKDLGVFIAIDDFGTGWSSLSYLRRLPVDFVKFDRTFTADVATDQDAALLISLMNRLAHALGLETVAEGIETAAQLAAVRRLGCDHVQGFHLARPAPASAR